MSELNSPPNWCDHELGVINRKIRSFVGESNETMQLMTKSGASYRTSLYDERVFQFLVEQIPGDKLTEIRHSDLTQLDRLKNSANIGIWIKSRLERITSI